MPNVIRQTALRILIATFVAVGMLSLAACNAANGGNMMPAPNAGRNAQLTTPTAATKPDSMRRPWNAVHNWAYWLDNPNLDQISRSNYELVVIDYSADGSAAKAFTARQIETLRNSSCQRRVVAYLSIGQAESYRGYWQSNWKEGSPIWLAAPDPDWSKNYWVHYWDPAWQRIIYHYLDAIIAAGFDGVYLDRIDAYQEDYAAGHEDDMVRFVSDIAQYARSHSPLGEDFGIIAQNAEDLAQYHPRYVRLLTGIGREEVYIQATNQPTSAVMRNTVEHNLDFFRQNSRAGLVLTVDYATNADMIRIAYEHAHAKGYIPYVTQVALDHLQINAGYEPVCRPVTPSS
ncbi:MAG TPA: MJ1477/TM1410 family putative glycoside hydrolase [Ktedonosporobacter sp.]|jgi:cysteinyl-tRNA synthetase|nr:MJ1477/TM1410 family putative glycoside hydrolase [Ktedonosporobacter sp.]